MLNRDQKFGQKSESIAVQHLKQHGYQIVARNYRTKLGEIDIIAREQETLVFVEVKSRTSAQFGRAKYAVTVAKQKKVSLLALAYLKKHKLGRTKARFDVVALDAGRDTVQIEIIKNAFPLAYK